MKREPAISFRPGALRSLLQERAGGSLSLQAKADLADYYTVVEQVLRQHPQKFVGLAFIYRHYLKHGTVRDKVGITPGFAYDVACSRLREQRIDVPSMSDFAAAGFRLIV